MSQGEPVIRPGAIMLTLLLMGISTLFAGLCAAYLYTIISGGIEAPRPPLPFLINIAVLVAATYFLKGSFKAYTAHTHPAFRTRLWICLLLTFAFVVLQILGWIQFFQEIPMNATQARSFLFVLSALHMLHVLAGIPLLGWFMWKTRDRIDDILLPLRNYRGFLRGLVRYWNFLDILWILLIAVLSIGFSLKWL